MKCRTNIRIFCARKNLKAERTPKTDDFFIPLDYNMLQQQILNPATNVARPQEIEKVGLTEYMYALHKHNGGNELLFFSSQSPTEYIDITDTHHVP